MFAGASPNSFALNIVPRNFGLDIYRLRLNALPNT